MSKSKVIHGLQTTALKYPKDAEAPFIVAQGKALIAQRMIEIAKENNVPIIVEPETEGILSLYDVGECIPYETYEVLAKIFAFIRRIDL